MNTDESYLPPYARMNWYELRKAQDAAVAKTAGRELIPLGLQVRIEFAYEQIRKCRAGEDPQPEEGTLWRQAQ